VAGSTFKEQVKNENHQNWVSARRATGRRWLRNRQGSYPVVRELRHDGRVGCARRGHHHRRCRDRCDDGGQFFLAEENSSVFNRISHPIISKVMDGGATVTQFAIGFIMIAGAGAVVDQQWGVQPWLGTLGLTIIIALVGLLDVDRVSTIIGGATPLIVVVIFIVFV